MHGDSIAIARLGGGPHVDVLAGCVAASQIRDIVVSFWPAQGPESASVWRRAVGKAQQFGESACQLGASGDGVHGAYLNGWRNASAALTLATSNTDSLAVRASLITIWVCPVSRSHSSETVKPSWRRVSSSMNMGILLALLFEWRCDVVAASLQTFADSAPTGAIRPRPAEKTTFGPALISSPTVL
jgi:hypothetical protein